jgi:hypothetical protein
MKEFIKLRDAETGLTILIKKSRITLICEVPANGDDDKATIIVCHHERRADVVSETAKEIQQLMEDDGDNEDDTSADDCDPDNSLRKYI